MMIGTRVRRSNYSLESLRLETLNGRFREQYNEKRAERGTVITPPEPRYCEYGGIAVRWDNGRISYQLSYMLTEVSDDATKRA